jgi:hypothetical protein
MFMFLTIDRLARTQFGKKPVAAEEKWGILGSKMTSEK